MLDGTATVIMKPFIVVSPDVPAWKVLFDPFQKFHVFGHHVFKLAVFRAVFHHPDLAVALKDRGFDFSYVIGDKTSVIFFSVDNLLSRLLHTCGTERIR